jgi:NIPSNAP
MITSMIRYTLDRNKLADFEQYARVWMKLIEKYGGTHHGYFVPHDSPPAASFSFSDIGTEGSADVAIALFSFPSIEAYEKYRRDVSADEECIAETLHYNQTKCFTKYERSFLKLVARN